MRVVYWRKHSPEEAYLNQLLLRINTPPGCQTIYRDKFREMLAKAADGKSILPPLFFHYGEDGKPLPTGEAEIRTIGAKNWVGVLAKTGNADLFDPCVGIATRVAANHYGSPAKMEVMELDYGLEASQMPIIYNLSRAAFKRRSPKRRALSTEEIIKDYLLRQLADEAERFGFDLPKDSALRIQVHHAKEMGMRLNLNTGLSNEYVSLVDASFSMYLELKGMWQIGNLQARGHGLIYRAKPGKEWS